MQNETNSKKLKDLTANQSNYSTITTTLPLANKNFTIDECNPSDDLASYSNDTYSLNSELSFFKEPSDCATEADTKGESVDPNSKWHKYL